MKKLVLLLAVIISTVNILPCTATQKFYSDSFKNEAMPNPIFNNIITIPQDYIMGVEIKEPINVNKLNIADTYKVYLKNDFLYNGELIAQEGSIIIGTITKIEKNNNEETKPYINIRFTRINTPSGQDIPISAIFNTIDNNGNLYTDENGIINTNIELDIKIMQPITYIQKK